MTSLCISTGGFAHDARRKLLHHQLLFCFRIIWKTNIAENFFFENHLENFNCKKSTGIKSGEIFISIFGIRNLKIYRNERTKSGRMAQAIGRRSKC